MLNDRQFWHTSLLGEWGRIRTPNRRFSATKSTVGAPKGRDSIAQGGAPIRGELVALGSLADRIGKPQRGEIPVWCNSLFANGITPLQGSSRNSYRFPVLRFASPWAIESRRFGADATNAGTNPADL